MIPPTKHLYPSRSNILPRALTLWWQLGRKKQMNQCIPTWKIQASCRARGPRKKLQGVKVYSIWLLKKLGISWILMHLLKNLLDLTIVWWLITTYQETIASWCRREEAWSRVNTCQSTSKQLKHTEASQSCQALVLIAYLTPTEKRKGRFQSTRICQKFLERAHSCNHIWRL